MPGNPASILSACKFFGQVNGASRQRLLAMGIIRRFAKGTVIFRPGDDCPGVYILGSGLVRVFKTSPSGREHVLHLISPGGTFAEVAAMGDFPCPAFAEALEDSVCLLLPAGPFGRALREDHELCLGLMASMAGWVKHLVGLLEDIALRDAVGRVARYLLGASESNGAIKLPGLKKHLASHLNLTSETLSRTLRRLIDMELIEEQGQRLVVRDRQALADAAEGDYPLL